MQLKAALLAAVVGVSYAAACDDFDRLRASLRTNRNGVGDSLMACVAPLLVAPMQWLQPSQATEFCEQYACVRVVRELSQLNPCAWTAPVPADSDGNALAMAQQVLRDCSKTT